MSSEGGWPLLCALEHPRPNHIVRMLAADFQESKVGASVTPRIIPVNESPESMNQLILPRAMFQVIVACKITNVTKSRES
jgi:hypothetical protein